MKIVIVLPTYNEKDNIRSIIDEIFHETANLSHDLHVLVVDDNSPDGTGKIVEDIITSNPKVHLLRGEKQGLGSAYIRGFKMAMEKLDPDVIFEMDADGSHPPKYIAPMVKAIEDGADVAVGTRYIKGGSIPKDWGFIRKLLSGFGNFVARFVLLTPQYHDMTTGFRATRTDTLRKINLEGLLSKRFAYKIHLFHALHMQKAKIVEVPFDFIDREQGASKMITNDMIDALRVILTIRMHESRQIIKFLIVGTVGFLVNATVLYILDDTTIGSFLPPSDTSGRFLFFPLKDTRLFWASVMAVETSIISNFVLNENWTFKTRDRSGSPLVRFSRFNVSSLGSPIISLTVINTLTPHFGAPKLISLAIGTMLGLFWNYTMNVLWIWRAKNK